MGDDEVKQGLDDACTFFKEQSHYIWERIAFARNMNIRISETTITEQLLYNFYKAYWLTRAPVRLFESVMEHRNGSDFEILVKTREGFLLLACQAKITYKNGKYRSFFHKIQNVQQIELLQNYAYRHGGVAQYLLYNYVPWWQFNKPSWNRIKPADYGLTHVSADEIELWSKESGGTKSVPGFHDLHPAIGFPFHLLIESLLKHEDPYKILFPDCNIENIKHYTEEQINDAKTWRLVTKPAQIGFIKPQDAKQYDFEKQHLENDNSTSPTFSPKFRLIIGGETSRGALYLVS